jgi:hypothetical protein
MKQHLPLLRRLTELPALPKLPKIAEIQGTEKKRSYAEREMGLYFSVLSVFINGELFFSILESLGISAILASSQLNLFGADPHGLCPR